MVKERGVEREVFLTLVSLANRQSLQKIDGAHLSLIGPITLDHECYHTASTDTKRS